MKTSRQQILDFILLHRVATVAELSRVLHMTEANVRRHLAILEEQDRVEVVGHRPPQGKGRPAQIFAPSELTLGDNLDLLSNALLAEFSQVGGDGIPINWLRRVAERLATEMSVNASPHKHDPPIESEKPDETGSDSATRSGSLTSRLFQAVQSLNQRHYQARWEAHSDGPRLLLGHCPYAAILEKHPELCRMDAYILEDLVGTSLEQVAKLARNSRGMTFCIFRIRE
jgi:predicted ArsR family transcriptional regulator